MAPLSLKERDASIDGALLQISQALHRLSTSLREFQEAETALRSESADYDGAKYDRNFLGAVAGTVKETVGSLSTLVLDIEAKPEIQKLYLLVLQKSITVPSCAIETVRPLRRAAVERAVGCRHFCALHAELMDPTLWSTLPEELVQLALARLPVSKLLAFFAHSRGSLNFRKLCHESHPTLFGLMAQEMPGERLRILVYDNEWINHDLIGFHQPLDWPSKYACDGGLVCFVPETRMLTTSAIRIGNPLTDQWKDLPLLPFLPFQRCSTIMVQLVKEEFYQVILVFGDEKRRVFSAQCYSSRTRLWSAMESGHVYGDRGSLIQNQVNDSRVFDCTSNTMHHLVSRKQKAIRTSNAFYRFVDPSADPSPYLEGVYARRCTMVRDRLFVLHECPKGLMVSEYAWERSQLRMMKSSAPEYLPGNQNLVFFGCGRSVFLLVESDQLQLIRVYDSASNGWRVLPDMGDDLRDQISDAKLQPAFWCELRWDVSP